MAIGGVSLSLGKERFRGSVLQLCKGICVIKTNVREKLCSCVCLCDCQRQTHFNLSQCCHQSALSVMPGGATKEHASCMRDREKEGEGITLTSRH